jgi:dipeptidyl aminopeptidase/acylaminoacyl peptidase
MKQMRTGMIGAACLLAGGLAVAAEGPAPLDQLVRNPQYRNIQISPTGEYIAATAPRGDQEVLITLRLSDLKPLGITTLPDKKSVVGVRWAGPNRVVFTSTRKVPGRERPRATGEWYAQDADGAKPRVLISYGTKGATDRSKQVGREGFGFLAALPHDDGKVLMQTTRPSGTEKTRNGVVELDTLTGRRRNLLSGPDTDCTFAADRNAEVRYANCSRRLDGTRSAMALYRRDGGNWTKIHDSGEHGVKYGVQYVMDDGRALAFSDDGKETRTVGWFGADGEFTPVHRDPVSDPVNVVIGFDGRTPLGVVTMPHRAVFHLFDEDSPEALRYLSLANAFPDDHVVVSSTTQDGRYSIIAVGSDRNAGEYYLFDADSGQARYLLSSRPWIKPAQMAAMQPFSMTARDGMVLHGYLTRPVGAAATQRLPTIVYVHGGPYGPRDTWFFDENVQIMASRGYQVLQVNFRGSGGYGNAFIEAGHREWGGTMQDDVTDATLWAFEKGYADPARTCIYGASYGAYAALMGAAKEPDLYRCAAGYVGVYDLEMMYNKGDIQEANAGQEYLRKILGTDPADLRARSPARLAAQIKAPVFLAAGMRDVRTPPEQTVEMYNALKAAGKEVPKDDYILQAGEEHGFYDEASKLNYFTRLLGFFGRHLDAPAASAATP